MVMLGLPTKLKRLKAPSQQGFTLFEVIVVMTLFGLLAAIALPNLPGLSSAVSRLMNLRDAKAQILSLTHRAYADSKPYVLSPKADRELDSSIEAPYPEFDGMALPRPATVSRAPLDLPDDWIVASEEQIIFYPNGFCSGGTVVIESYGRILNYQLQAPHCDKLLEQNS